MVTLWCWGTNHRYNIYGTNEQAENLYDSSDLGTYFFIVISCRPIRFCYM